MVRPWQKRVCKRNTNYRWRRWNRFRSRWHYKKQWDYKLNDASENIESIQDCLKRSKKFINKINKKYKNKNILIVSHGSFIKTLHFNLIGYDENTDFISFSPKNAIVYEYELK